MRGLFPILQKSAKSAHAHKRCTPLGCERQPTPVATEGTAPLSLGQARILRALRHRIPHFLFLPPSHHWNRSEGKILPPPGRQTIVYPPKWHRFLGRTLGGGTFSPVAVKRTPLYWGFVGRCPTPPKGRGLIPGEAVNRPGICFTVNRRQTSCLHRGGRPWSAPPEDQGSLEQPWHGGDVLPRRIDCAPPCSGVLWAVAPLPPKAEGLSPARW